MAIYQGDEIVDVTTPDGRTLKLPRSVVPSSLLPAPQQIGAAPGFTDETVYNVTEPEIPSVTGGSIDQVQNPDTQVVDAPPVQSAPDYQLATLNPPSTPREVARSNKQYEQKQAKQAQAKAAYQASPQGQMAGVQKQTQSAFTAEKSAIVDAAVVEAAAQDMIGEAHAKANERLDKIFSDRAKAAEDLVLAEQKKNDELISTRKKIASTKIDRKSDHPIINALGIAMMNIGAAMDGDKSAPGFEFFWRALDRKVQNQMGDLDLMEKTYGMQKDELSALKDVNNRKLEVYNTLIAGEADKAKRHLEEIVAKSAGEQTKAKAQILMAQIDQRAAVAHQDAVRWGLEYDQKDKHQKAQIGLGYANLAESRRSNMVGEQLKREDMYLDWQKHLASLKASGDEAAYKAQLKMGEELSKRGIRDINGEFLLSKDGRAMMSQAQQLEDEAAKLVKATENGANGIPTPETMKAAQQRAGMLRERAAQLRGQASLTGGVLASNDTEAVAMSNMMASGQSVIQLIDEIKVVADQVGRGVLQRDKAQAKLQAMFNQLKPGLKEAWQLGSWDKGASNLVADIIGSDPSSEWNAGVLGAVVSRKMLEDPNAFKGRLDAVASDLENRAKNKLVQKGAKFGDKDTVFNRATGVDTGTPAAKASAAISEGRTPTEAEAASEPSTLGKIRDKVYAFGGGLGKGSVLDQAFGVGSEAMTPAYEANKSAAVASGSLTRVGLNPQQAQGFDTLLKAYKGGDAGAGDALVAQVSNYAEQRPELAGALARNLREHAPDLYTKARLVLPKGGELDKQLGYEESARAGVSLMPTQMLVQNLVMTLDENGKITDQEAWKDLSRRATTGDPEAKSAMTKLVQEIGKRKLPQGSVFREGR